MASNVDGYYNGTAEANGSNDTKWTTSPELYYNNSRKFESTNTVVSVTGNGTFYR